VDRGVGIEGESKARQVFVEEEEVGEGIITEVFLHLY